MVYRHEKTHECSFTELVNGKFPYYETIRAKDVTVVGATEIETEKGKALMLITNERYRNSSNRVAIFIDNIDRHSDANEAIKKLRDEVKKGPAKIDITLVKLRSMNGNYPFTLATTPSFSELNIKEVTASLSYFVPKGTTLDDFFGMERQ
ncbi:MAG: hypothetical protein ACP5RF_03380 [Candidatus Micrarchaeia archaeon]